MKFRELQRLSNVYSMLYDVFKCNDCEDNEVTITKLDEGRFTVRIVDVVATEACGDPTYNCTVNISFGADFATCEILCDDNMSDDSIAIFEMIKGKPEFREFIYK